jgi:hypothetical protein
MFDERRSSGAPSRAKQKAAAACAEMVLRPACAPPVTAVAYKALATG